jgi:acyl-CoA synthetase (AMP-forming)/AMP-acid ligase II
VLFRSAYPDVVVPDQTLPDFLFATLSDDDAARTAVIDTATGQEFTYAELVDIAGRVAGGLARRGIGHGDVAALVAPNRAEYPAIFHGVLAAGAVLTPVNPLYTPSELAHQFRDGGVRIVFTTAGAADRVYRAAKEDGVTIDEIVVLDPGGSVSGTSFADFLTGAPHTPTTGVSGADLAVMPYSSGTTGLPKGVMLTHRNLVANLLQAHPLTRVRAGSRFLAVLPLFHIYGITGIMNGALHHRATLVTMPRFDLPAFLRAIEEHRIDHAFIAPPIALALANSPLVDDHDLSSLDVVMSAAAPLDAGLADRLSRRLKATVTQGFGLTESSPCTHGIPVDRPDIDRGSIGVLMPSVEARVVDPATRDDVAPGERGELWCRGPNVMLGYLNNPGATEAAVDPEGFLHTGDVVTVDDNGVFHVVDRLKELIKYKGYQVAPAELEAVLLAHEGIDDAAVIGVPDAAGEEVPKAFVTRRDTRPDLGSDEVLEFVAARVAPYKKIRAVEFLDAIPKSPAGKILRKELRRRERSGDDPQQRPREHVGLPVAPRPAKPRS